MNNQDYSTVDPKRGWERELSFIFKSQESSRFNNQIVLKNDSNQDEFQQRFMDEFSKIVSLKPIRFEGGDEMFLNFHQNDVNASRKQIQPAIARVLKIVSNRI
jgi:hypothetical protein